MVTKYHTHNFSVLEKWLIISRPNRGLQFAWLAGILQSWTKVLVDKGSYANGTTTIRKFLKEFNWSHREVHRGVLRQISIHCFQFWVIWAVVWVFGISLILLKYPTSEDNFLIFSIALQNKYKIKLNLLHIVTSALKSWLTYRMSHRYWANFLTSYLWLEPIFLGPDSISMTHETWQIDYHHFLRSILKIEIIFWSFKIFCLFFPKSKLGNLDPYSGT